MAKLALIFMSTCFFAGDLFAGGHVMHSKQLPTAMFGGSDISPREMFIDADGNTFIIVEVNGSYGGAFLYINDNLTDLERYVGVGNGFLKDGHFHFVLWRDGTIFIYKVERDIKLVSRISIADSSSKFLISGDVDRVIPASGPSNSYYLLGSYWRLPAHPIEFLKTVLSAGHGISYRKPFLVEVRDEKLTKPRKLRYGGKIDESYYIKKVLPHKDLVHFLGFRMQEEPDRDSDKRALESRMLHHAAYDFKKKKAIHTHTIYTNTPKTEIDKNITTFYGPLSIDALGNDVFVAFSWVQERLQPRPIPVKDIKSTIFYWDYNQGEAGDVEKIAEGFHPLVKVDLLGNVHLLRVNKNGSLVHKAKRNGKWGKDIVLVNNLDVDYGIIATKCVAAEFDKENNLHVVYPSEGNLVHAVVKVN